MYMYTAGFSLGPFSTLCHATSSAKLKCLSACSAAIDGIVSIVQLSMSSVIINLMNTT